jgi:hypothetical protein
MAALPGFRKDNTFIIILYAEVSYITEERRESGKMLLIN